MFPDDREDNLVASEFGQCACGAEAVMRVNFHPACLACFENYLTVSRAFADKILTILREYAAREG